MNQKIEKYIEDKIKMEYIDNNDVFQNPTAYVYDLAQITDNINNIERYAPEQLKLYYAMKANKQPDVMKLITSHKFVQGVEIASCGELDIALNYVKSNNILFTGPGKTNHELIKSIDEGIRLINVESLTEAYRLDKIAEHLGKQKVDILLRINTNYYIDEAQEYMAGKSTKLGIDENDFLTTLNEVLKLKHINVRGIHVFSASGVMNYNALLKYVNYVFNLVKEIEDSTNFKQLEIIDFGGGVGIDYRDIDNKFNVRGFFDGVRDLIKAYSFHDKELIMELGTYLVGNAGYYTAKIIDIKETKGYKHIIIAGGVNHSGLQLEMQRKHPVCIIPMDRKPLYSNQPYVKNEVVDISGPCCMCNDKLSWNQYIEEAHIGDIVVFLQSGAYCYEEAMVNFLSHPLPNHFNV